jgi:hypothetical protein
MADLCTWSGCYRRADEAFWTANHTRRWAHLCEPHAIELAHRLTDGSIRSFATGWLDAQGGVIQTGRAVLRWLRDRE